MIDFQQLVLDEVKKDNDNKYKGIIEQSRELYMAVAGTLTKFTVQDNKVCHKEVLAGKSSQEEADTRFVTYASLAKTRGHDTVRVHTPDSDVFFILQLHHEVLKDINIEHAYGVGKNKRLLKLWEVRRASGYTDAQWDAIVCWHVDSGVDSTSRPAWYRVIPNFERMVKSDAYVKAYSTLGKSLDHSTIDFDTLEKFLCETYGGKNKFTKLNDLRAHMLITKCNGDLRNVKPMDLARLPPCFANFKQHILRVNYQLFIWRKANQASPNIPSPVGHGWKLVDGVLYPRWSEHEDETLHP